MYDEHSNVQFYINDGDKVLESDIIFPNAKCYFDDKSFITYRLSLTQSLFVYLNRFMNEFSTIEIE